MPEAKYAQELRNFLDDAGRLAQYPAKLKLKIKSLFYLSTKFLPGKRYSD